MSPPSNGSGRSPHLIGALFALALLITVFNTGQAQDVKPVTIEIRPMLKITVIIKPGGAEVKSVNLAGPAARMARADNSKIRGIMEVDDIITKVGMTPIRTVEDLRNGLAAAGKITITVWDKNSRKEIDWIVNPE